jgi:hypothetical protein
MPLGKGASDSGVGARKYAVLCGTSIHPWLKNEQANILSTTGAYDHA